MLGVVGEGGRMVGQWPPKDMREACPLGLGNVILGKGISADVSMLEAPKPGSSGIIAWII